MLLLEPQSSRNLICITIFSCFYSFLWNNHRYVVFRDNSTFGCTSNTSLIMAARQPETSKIGQQKRRVISAHVKPTVGLLHKPDLEITMSMSKLRSDMCWWKHLRMPIWWVRLNSKSIWTGIIIFCLKVKCLAHLLSVRSRITVNEEEDGFWT